jgi:hypothetical protein
MMSISIRRRTFAICVGLAFILNGWLASAAAAATTHNVSSVAGLETAIDAVNAGPGGDRIVLAAGVYMINAPLRIDQDVAIEGNPSAPTVIDGGGLFTILDVNANNISVQNLTLRNASTAISYEGRGVFSGTGLTITSNETGFSPGDSGGVTFFTNSTISGNRGPGITISCAELHLINVTVSGNDQGVNFAFPCGERMEFTNTLIVANGQDCSGGGSFDPVGTASLDSDGTCATTFGFAPGLTTVVNLGALALGDLASNGGPTATHAILETSVARNAGDNAACPATDQRGFLRDDGACDIGAYEHRALPGGNNTPPGSNVVVSPAPGLTLTFSQVTAAGDTTVTTGGTPPPTGFQVDGLVYDISTTAGFTGPVTVCLPYNPSINRAPRLYHHENLPPPTWVNRTTAVDESNHVVCGTVSSLSPFAVLMPIDVTGRLQELQVLINSFNLKKPAAKKFMHRVDKLRRAWVTEQTHHPHRFCDELAKFVKAVHKESGKKLTRAEANELLERAALLAIDVGC